MGQSKGYLIYGIDDNSHEILRGRLSIAASNYSIASRIISDTIAAGLIKLEDSSKSRKYAQYIPIWA
jgi:hypothetical protein